MKIRTMKSTTPVILGLLLNISWFSAHAALAPSVVTIRDLDVLVAFVKQHQKVADTLEMIDMRTHSILFDGDCLASFERPTSWNPMSRPGPQAEIEFKDATCSLEYN
ncbi:MAG: hypothetical protein ACRBBW_11920 [Cellvibrionaceae bacterium]